MRLYFESVVYGINNQALAEVISVQTVTLFECEKNPFFLKLGGTAKNSLSSLVWEEAVFL